MTPTSEQIRKLLEACGFKFTPHLSSKGNQYKKTEIMEYPEGFKHIVCKGESLEIDPLFLFEYAVPNLESKGFNIHIHLVSGKKPKVIVSNAYVTYLKSDDVLATALFWPCYKAFGLEEWK